MHKVIDLKGKRIDVEITDVALTVLNRSDSPILAELELYFSCLIRKKINFRDQGNEEDCVPVIDNLNFRYRPVMTRVCGKDYETEFAESAGTKEPPLTDFPIKNIKPYIPTWVKIDFRNGQWKGEFGFTESEVA